MEEIAKAAAVPVLQADAAAHSPRSPDPAQDLNGPPRAVRHRLPDERASITHKFSIAGHEGYITVGLYPTGQPGEIFIKMAKEGSTVSGLMDAFATSISLALQHGVPLKVLCEKFAHTRFEPSGWTGNEQIGYAKSLMDYIFRWLNLRFLSGTQLTLFAGLGAAGAATARLAQHASRARCRRRTSPRRTNWPGWPRRWPSGCNQVSRSAGSHVAGGGIAPEAQSAACACGQPHPRPRPQRPRHLSRR